MVDQTPYSIPQTNYAHDEGIPIDSIKARFRNVVKRHAELTDRLSRDSDKMIFERLQKEFDTAQASQTQEIYLEGEDWNDGFLATIRERVHMEAERKASGDSNMLLDSPLLEKVTYRVGSKVICCLEGARIGIQYETSFAGEPCEFYHCVLESKSFLEKMTVQEHTVPFFLPIREAENDLLSSNAMKFIDHVGELLQAYVDRRNRNDFLHVNLNSRVCQCELSSDKVPPAHHKQSDVCLMKELYGNQIGDLYHSLPYHMIEFVLDDFECTRITISLKYADLVMVLPTRVRVMAWPLNSYRKESAASPSNLIPARLSYAEDALRILSLPEAFAEFVLNLPQALEDTFPSPVSNTSSED